MTRLLNRLFCPRTREQMQYQHLLQSPAGSFVTLALATAVAEHATKVTYGLPPGTELSAEDDAEIRANHQQFQREFDAAFSPDELQSLHSDLMIQFHRRDGLPEIPLWREIEGKWFRDHGIPTWLYAYVPQNLSNRLVSLGNKPTEGGKEEWIECTSFRSGNNRDFVRIDLVFEVNNSATVEFLETCSVRNEAKVWWHQRRV
jgi:hypothetical protein